MADSSVCAKPKKEKKRKAAASADPSQSGEPAGGGTVAAPAADSDAIPSAGSSFKKKLKKQQQLAAAAASGAATSTANGSAVGGPAPSAEPSSMTEASGAASDRKSIAKAEKAARKALKRQQKAEAAEAAAASGVSAPVSEAESPTKELSKKARRIIKKKQKKADAKAEAKSAAAASATSVDGPSAGASGSDATAAKLSKKERKRLQSQAAASGPAAVNGGGDGGFESEASVPAAKKQKKAKSAGASTPLKPAAAAAAAAAAKTLHPRRLANVGSVQLATSSPPIVRSTYTEHAETAGQSAADVAKLRESRRTIVEGSDLKSVRAFEHSGFGPQLLQATAAFTAPSPIQSETWAPAASGRDVIGIAATGSGKTLAFGLPALAHTRAQLAAGVADGTAPSVLILAPTRELAMQIAGVLEAAGQPLGLATLCAYGGVPKPPQTKALRRGVNVLVATPGRLEDLMNDGAARLHHVTFLVLDEADRMLDLGFEPHIRAIATQTRADRQTLMFSATWPTAIQKLASEFLADPVKVTIGSADLSASHSVSQTVEVIDPRQRDRRLPELLKKFHGTKRQNRIIVFVLYKKEAARVEQSLNRAGWKAVAVHGDASQAQRTAAVDSFKSGDTPLLIATDVAARGLDIDDVEVVINYSFPLTTEDYVHRIGRTGRAGKTGHAHTFFSGETDKPRAGELINVLREAGQPVPDALLAFGTTVKKKESKLYGAHFRDVDFSKKATKVTFDDDSD